MEIFESLTNSKTASYEIITRFFDGSKGMTLIVSVLDQYIVYCNAVTAQFYGLEPTQIVGKPLDTIAETKFATKQTLFDKILSQLNTRFYARQLLRNGSVKELEFFCNKAYIDQQEFLLVQIHDVTRHSSTELRQVYNTSSLQPIFNSLPNILIRTTCTGEILNTNLPLETDFSKISNTYGLEYGKILGCIYALRLENGCGSGNVCKHCDLRSMLRRTFETQQSCPATIVKLHAKTKNEPLQDRYYEVFTNFLEQNGQSSVLISLSDVTDRLQTAQKLNISQAQLWAVIESSSDFVWVVDPECFSITLFNSAIKQFVETVFNRAMCVGQSIHQMFPEALSSQINHFYNKLLADGAFTTEIYVQDFELYLQLSFNRVEIDGNIVGISVFGKDTTTSKLSEIFLQQRNQLLNEHQQELDIKQSILEGQNEQIMRTNEELQKALSILESAKCQAEESSNLKTAILANLNHEIRTPLNAINGFADLLIRPTIPQDKKETYAQMLRQSGIQLLTIVNNLLEAARLESGLVKLHHEIVDLQFLADEIYTMFVDLASQKGITLSVKINKQNSANYEIKTDPARLKQLLGQLIDNALKFTREGKVFVEFSPQEDALRITVGDTGIGIAPQMQTRIFELFEQIDMQMTREYGGNGLGLGIVKGIVKLFGGTLSVESEVGMGAKFVIELPHVVTSVTRNQDSSQKTSIQTILIAEDDDINYSYLEAILLINCITIVRAYDGGQAIELCKANSDIDLVLMDIRMPTVNGIDAMRQIKRNRPDLPIIATTAFGLADDRAKLITYGFDDYISKPINANTLWTVLQMQWRKLRNIVVR